jgi:DNA-directed RNA polymerase subunit RPC12/RpoP
MRNVPRRLLVELGPQCVECGRRWLDLTERWRAYLTIDDEAHLWCPECSRREFGS